MDHSELRFFAWVRTRIGKKPVEPQIIYVDADKQSVGPKLEVVARRLLHPAEYGLPLNVLAARYPAPAIADAD